MCFIYLYIYEPKLIHLHTVYVGFFVIAISIRNTFADPLYASSNTFYTFLLNTVIFGL